MSNETNLTPGADGIIPLATAKSWAAKWRTHLSNSGDVFQGRSFLIPAGSINTLLTNSPNLEGIRAYIALEDENDTLTGKLVLVAVVDGEEVLTLPGNESAAVDLVQICPPFCPTGGGPTIES